MMVAFAMDSASPVLWWQERVARALAGRCERLLVLTEQLGRATLPANAAVRVVPRWMQRAPARLAGAKRLMTPAVAAWCRREAVTVCLVHMAAEWVPQLHLSLDRLGIPIVLWYAHGTVTPALRRAHTHAVRVLTSTAEGFRIPSDKVSVIGQGIDTERFPLRGTPPDPRDVIVVGRVSPRKRIHVAIEAFAEARRVGTDLRLRIVGPTLNRTDRRYARDLADQADRLGVARSITFEGPRAVDDLAGLYQTALGLLSLSETGSLDKAPLEALASGCPVLVAGEAFRTLLRGLPAAHLEDDRPGAIARRLVELAAGWRAWDPGMLRGIVVGRHDLDHYLDQVMSALEMASRLKGRER